MSVAPERLDAWLAGFAARHGPVTAVASAEQVAITAADGAEAVALVPFPPLRANPGGGVAALVAHAGAERTVGVLLVRLGGHAAGVFTGADLITSKVGSRPVHGRSAAGGRSQKRFARRRENQAEVALAAAADAAAAVLLPAAPGLAALVVGGDRRAVEAVLADPRLVGLRPLVTDPFLDLPDPRQRVLAEAGQRLRAVRIRLRQPAPAEVGDG